MIQRPVGHSQSISNTVIPDLPHAGLPDELFNPQPLKPGARMDVTSKAEWRMSPEDYERSVSIMHGFHATSSEEAIAYFPPLFDVGRMRLRETQRTYISIVNNLRAVVAQLQKEQAFNEYVNLKLASAVPVDYVALTEVIDVDTVSAVMESMMISPPPAGVGPPRNIPVPPMEPRPILPPYTPFEIGGNYEMLSTPSPSPRKRKREDTSLY